MSQLFVCVFIFTTLGGGFKKRSYRIFILCALLKTQGKVSPPLPISISQKWLSFPNHSFYGSGQKSFPLLSPEVFFNFSTCFQLLNIVPLGLNQCPGVSITTFCSSSHSVWQGSKKEMHVFLWSFLPGEDNLIFNVL